MYLVSSVKTLVGVAVVSFTFGCVITAYILKRKSSD